MALRWQNGDGRITILSVAKAWTVFMVVRLLVAVLLALSSSSSLAGPTEPAYLYRATVIKVIDGDTIDVNIDLGFYVWLFDQRIRLIGIDAPEIRRGKNREAGRAAKRYLRRLLDGKTVILRTFKAPNKSGDMRDGFRRWAAVVYVDGENVNLRLVNAGHAIRKPWHGIGPEGTR